MHKTSGRILCFLLSLLMLCVGASFAAAEPTEPTPSEAMQAYLAVLFGGQPYIRCNLFDNVTEESSLTDEITDWYGYLFDPPFTFAAFALTDLDGNGVPELLLQLSGYFGYELLRYENDQVYGYPFVYRAMQAVTQDGEIASANGADNYGWYRISFDGATMNQSVVCWKHDEQTITDSQYVIGDAQSTEEDFCALDEALWSKPAIAFTDYSQEAVEAAAASVLSIPSE